MTVASTERKQSFTTNGVTVDFPFTFKATDANQIYCQYTPNGGDTADYTNFTVVLQEAGGTVTTNDVLGSGTLLVYRIVPLTQNTDYVEGGRFPAESHEAALDKLTLIDQDQQEDISRALKGPIGKDNPYTLAETLAEDELLIMQINEIKSSGTTIDDLNNAIENANNAAQNAEKVLINLPSGQWSAGITFNSANEFMNFNGVGYTPLPTTTFPYVTQGNDPTQAPDNAFVQPFSNVNSSNISTYTDLVFDSVANMQSYGLLVSGNRITIIERANSTFLIESGTADGYSKIDTTQSGLIARLIPDYKRDIPLRSFGVDFDADQLQAACNFLQVTGGLISIDYDTVVNIDANVSVPRYVSIAGPHGNPASPGDNNDTDYTQLKGRLEIDSSATITLNSSATISGLLITRSGLVIPSVDSSSFAGTAITINGDDCAVFQCMILGFDMGVTSKDKQRLRVRDCSMDNQNCVKIENSLDVAYLTRVHCWPFVTINQASAPIDWANRGKAFEFINVGDWTKVTDCFTYGYFRGFQASSVNSMRFMSCSCDGTVNYSGSIGFNIESGCTDTKLIGCQAAAQDTGYRLDADLIADLPTELIGCDAWGNINNGALIDGGDVRITGGIWRNSVNGIAVNNASSNVFIDNARFSNLSSIPINLLVATENVRLGDNNEYSGLGVGGIPITQANLEITNIATANVVSIQADKRMFNLTGSVMVSLIGSGWTGREITLVAADGTTLVHGGNDGPTPGLRTLKLAGNANAVLSAGDTITLRHNGTFWYEVARA